MLLLLPSHLSASPESHSKLASASRRRVSQQEGLHGNNFSRLNHVEIYQPRIAFATRRKTISSKQTPKWQTRDCRWREKKDLPSRTNGLSLPRLRRFCIRSWRSFVMLKHCQSYSDHSKVYACWKRTKRDGSSERRIWTEQNEAVPLSLFLQGTLLATLRR